LKRKQNENSMVSGLRVEVRNGDFNKALRLFKKKVQNDGVIQEYRERQEYIKPSEKRKKAKAAGKARWKRKQEKLNPDNKRKF
jgi:small subunit ribosomal protein S21